MDSYQPPPHHFVRPPQPPQQPPPPPPPMASSDPNYPHHHPPPPPPPPQTSSWYSGQFQYHSSHSPSPPPPPPPQNQWGPPPPPPPSQQPPQYHHYQHHHPYYPPPPPPPPQPYSHQDWANANWNNHAGWEYPAHSNEEDWEAKARAWAAARSGMDTQFPARREDPSHYTNQYPVEAHYQDVQQTSVPTSNFPNYQGQGGPLTTRPPVNNQEPASISSYGSDPHFSFPARDGTLGGDISSTFSHVQGSTNSLVHKQEVPSSYSSLPGKEDGLHGHPSLHADRSMPLDHSQFAYGNHLMDPMDQPLDFGPRFSHENDSNLKLGYPDSSGPLRGIDSGSTASSLHAWTPPAPPGMSYPPITPPYPSAPQHDLSVGVPPLTVQPGPMLGSGAGFQPAIPSVTTPVGLGPAFSVDPYGASLGSERPKKAAVPNWLREEIIKNKATITSSAQEPFNDGSQASEDEIVVKSTGKSDQADSKSLDSARSTEDEDDEDYEEAQRTAAINQEIKRVLTEVLLKVTDELFDEIATKVLKEDDLSVDAVTNVDDNAPIHKVSPPPPPPPSQPPQPPLPAPKATAKILIPLKSKESDGHVSGESSSDTLGNVLGLANYASDDDDEIQNSSVPKSENGHQDPKDEVLRNNHDNELSVGVKGSVDSDTTVSKVDESKKKIKDLDNDAPQQGSTRSLIVNDVAKSMENGLKTTISRQDDVPIEKENAKKSYKDDSQERDVKRRDRNESKRSSSGRDNYKEVESGKERDSERRDEKRQKKDKSEEYNVSRERSKEQDGSSSSRHGDKTRESDSRKRSPHYEDKDSKRERERDKKRNNNDDVDKKRERIKDVKDEKSKHKSSSDGSRHKRRSRKNEDNVGVSDGSDGEASDDSRRKVHSRKHNLSPSPVRSRRRQVSRSPHSKHSHRRHSSYSSLDDSRGKRSRSRSKSPTRRRR